MGGYLQFLAVSDMSVIIYASLCFFPDLEFRLDDDLQFIPLRSTSDVQADWELLQPLCEPVPGQQQAGSASVVSRLVLDPSDRWEGRGVAALAHSFIQFP